ncbi:MAG: DUF4124 domain-containing protein [Nitrospirota bacterium]
MSASASATTLYTWRNTDGSVMFTDDPKGAPPNVQVHRYGDRHKRHFLKHKSHHKSHRDGHTSMTTDRIGHHVPRHVTPSHPAFKSPPRPHRNPGAPESYGARGPQKRPSVASASSTVSLNRIFRTSAPSEGRDRVSRVDQPRASPPGVRTVNTRAFASDRAVVSTDDSSNQGERRIAVGRRQHHGRGFSLGR